MNKIKLKLSFDYMEMFSHWLAVNMLPPDKTYDSFEELAIEMQVSEIALQLNVFVNTPREEKKKCNIKLLPSYGFTILHLIYNYPSSDNKAFMRVVLNEVKKQLEDHFFVKAPFKFPTKQLSI